MMGIQTKQREACRMAMRRGSNQFMPRSNGEGMGIPLIPLLHLPACVLRQDQLYLVHVCVPVYFQSWAPKKRKKRRTPSLFFSFFL